jgi:hypothetical protein
MDVSPHGPRTIIHAERRDPAGTRTNRSLINRGRRLHPVRMQA